MFYYAVLLIDTKSSINLYIILYEVSICALQLSNNVV